MLVDGRVYKVLNFDDLNSLVSLGEWIKNNLTIYAEDEKISKNHLMLFLEHIKNNTKEQRVEHKRDWFDRVDELLERLNKNE